MEESRAIVDSHEAGIGKLRTHEAICRPPLTASIEVLSYAFLLKPLLPSD